jgi:serine/threonine protein kinase
MTPTVLNHRYQVVRVLASGGFGDTFLAEDSFLPSKRLCVIKQLKLLTDNPQVYELVQVRFQREAAILEELGRISPQIPELYAYFEESGRFYLVQEWIEGQTLAEKIRSEGVMSELAVKQLLEKTLPVLGNIHARGIIHRDIKPDNIIIRRRDQQTVLIDFGAVKESVGTMLNSQGQTTSSIVIGTPGYMPPEQGVGRPVFSSDLYSLGLTAIYLLTGKLPQDLPTNHHTGEFDAWRTYARTVSDRFAEILDRAIRYHPRDRFATAEAMLDALRTSRIIAPPAAPMAVAAPTQVSRAGTQPSVAIPPTYPHLPSAPPPASKTAMNYTSTASGTTGGNSSSNGSSPVSSAPAATSLVSPVPPTQVRLSAERTSRSLIAAGITATVISAIGGGIYFYYLQQVRPYQDAQARLAEIQTLQLRGDHQACLSKARTFPGMFPDLRDRLSAIVANCSSAQDERVLQQAVDIASQSNPDLKQAIAKAQEIPAASAVHPEAQAFMLKWQTSVLQAYIRQEVPQRYPQLAESLPSYQFTVEQVTPDQVVISYDTANNPRRADPESIRRTTALLMELLQGNEADVSPAYTEFARLVTYPRQGKQQGTLQSEQWQTYLSGKASGKPLSDLQDQLKAQIQVTAR